MVKFNQFHGTDQYISSRSLSDAVNVSMALERPLLLKGEPGTGKTLLAHHIAGALGMEMLVWNVKSTTKAREGLYTYDTVARLNDARFGEGDVKNIAHYIKLGPLGRAFDSEERMVLLIDEIDKADVEFPNDLLQELDEMKFDVVETGARIEAKNRPVVVITSNSEKELPDAFLRRCVFHFIDFPDGDEMERIVNVHFPELPAKLLKDALRIFYNIREVPGLRKRPSTSELIDWIRALLASGATLPKGEETEVSAIPFLGVLMKVQEDGSTLVRHAERPVSAAASGRRYFR